ncbi:ABC transporter [Ornatilinea apprima]|uniref:ABC transporter n=1 Tax=Ornatilinea apprima TaxID=1134406 RepID=A0A0P6XWS0_9CHLR|nr:sugar ABC transporter permease [Ornatilinea apprima]KPL77889.1 ABC transporter [Ornatilinea apprima]
MIEGGVVLKSLGEVGTTVLYVLIGTVILEAILYLVLMRWLKYHYALPFMLLAPAIVGLLVLVVYPLIWELNLSFGNMSLRRFKNWEYVGFTNYVRVFTEPVLKQRTLWPLLGQTVLWTLINVVFHVVGGMILALLLNREMKGRGLYRMIIIIPWAIPQIIAVLAWRGEFNFEYGFLNVILTRMGLAPIQWLTTPGPNFAAMCITNIWLGIPFMMVILLGGLQSISGDFYEAAEIDGANGWQQFWNITIPLMQPVMAPAIILGTVWTFNNFNVPFFINQFELESSDILVTALFRAAFQYNRYGFSAAFAFVIFIFLLVYSIFYLRVTGALKGVR